MLSESSHSKLTPAPNEARNSPSCLSQQPAAVDIWATAPLQGGNDISLGQWVPTDEVMKSGEHHARWCVWRLALWPPSLKAGAHFVRRHFPSFPLAQSLLDTSGRSHHTVTSLSCSLGFWNFNVGNCVFPKNNILITCPLDPNRRRAVILPKKRQGRQDPEFKVS